MARIQTYTVDTTLNSGDMIIGTDGAQGANYATKNFTVGDLRTFILQGVSTYTNDNVDAHLNVSSAGPSQVLSWNGSDYTWVTRSSFSGNYNDLTNTPTLLVVTIMTLLILLLYLVEVIVTLQTNQPFRLVTRMLTLTLI